MNIFKTALCVLFLSASLANANPKKEFVQTFIFGLAAGTNACASIVSGINYKANKDHNARKAQLAHGIVAGAFIIPVVLKAIKFIKK